MRGVILAGGTGTRLWPLTLAVSKQLMPVYDKPMIYYPLSTLIQLGIRDILIITTPFDLAQFQRLLGEGDTLGINIKYAVQASPEGLAQALTIGARFIGDEPVTLILGDNIFHGDIFHKMPVSVTQGEFGAYIFAYEVSDPWRYGVVEFDSATGLATGLEEKPPRPRSRYAVPGLYIYDNRAVSFAKAILPSNRGELEITALNQMYLDRNQLHVLKAERGSAWLDTGTFESLTQASEYVRAVEHRTGIKIGCIEEAAYRHGLITLDQLMNTAKLLKDSGYGNYLADLVK